MTGVFSFAARGMAVISLAALAVLASAQETTATVITAEDAQSTESLAPLAVMTPEPAAEPVAAADVAATQTIVLLGEKVSKDDPDSAKGPFPDLVALTEKTVGGRVVDLTTHGLSMAQTAEMIGKAVIHRPDIVIVFTGFTDEKKETADDKQREALTAIVNGFEKSKARIFLVPASTTVGAMTSANLMLVATELGVNFVPIGTEVGGQPFIDAFESVQEQLAAPAEDAPVPVPATRPATAVTIQGGKIAEPKAAATPEVNYDQSRANIQSELSRIAGESGEGAILPSLEDAKLTTESILSEAPKETTVPEGGTLTKRGKDAQESINMRPLPAVKAFRPTIPVPRNQVETKEPGLSR